MIYADKVPLALTLINADDGNMYRRESVFQSVYLRAQRVNIMPIPKQRHTKSRRNKRRAHIFLKTHVFGRCQKCGKAVMPHMLCENCGSYKKREYIDVFAKLNKRQRKHKTKELKEQEAEVQEGVGMEELSK